MQKKQIIAIAIGAALLMANFVASASAGKPAGGQKAAGKNWNASHPRRAEVNQRLNNQNARINQGLKSGKMTSQQAQALHQADHQVRQEERADAAQNGGHITKAEQAQINQQENAISQQIYQEKHP